MKKRRKSMREKAIEMTVEGIVKEEIQNVQLDIFDLSKVLDEGTRAAQECMADAITANDDAYIEAAIRGAVKIIVSKLRKN